MALLLLWFFSQLYRCTSTLPYSIRITSYQPGGVFMSVLMIFGVFCSGVVHYCCIVSCFSTAVWRCSHADADVFRYRL